MLMLSRTIAGVVGFAVLIGTATARDSAQSVATLTGIAAVKDGDGLLFGGVEIRLKGIAAPEDGRHKVEPGGTAATQHLRSLAEGKHVICELDGTTTGRGSSNRPVAICFVEGRDLGEAQVAAGHARDCRRFSGGRYRDDEISARANGRDLSSIYPLPAYCM